MPSVPTGAGADSGGLFSLRQDPRTAHWAFSGNKELIALLLLGYLYVVKIAGPRFMKNRKPYEGIKPLIAMYNLAMVLLSAWFASAILSRTYVGGGYSILCQGIDFDAKDEKTMTLLSLLWWYYMVRLGDFLDTVFFILRKKDSHVSFLHVVHHALVVFNGWFGLTYGPDGHALVPVIVNACVHVFMYSYYFLSLLGPSVRKYLWWKRYLTQLQLVQFVILFIHAWLPLFFTCGYPRYHTYITLSETVFFFAMFTNFYIKKYKQRCLLTGTAGEMGRKQR